ncbi:MAG: ABC transporter ATP-binding protein/permease [Clostridium sp.]|nr:ABC transporter ATP-binding protein/permease [Acetatifactor muris]MCM1527810.1 ABC transporter ATP-binding protein/permease [Bacteroides sp.]MCM1563490.1 ABC transporter ATP-binding protein/permease [Clostridium sp.]
MRKNVFLKCVLRYSPLFVAELLLSWLLARAVVEGNSLIGTAVDTLVAGEKVEYTSFLAILLILTAAGFVAAFFKSIAASVFSILVQTRYKTLVAEKLYGLEYRYFDENGSATVINKMNADIAEADALLNDNLPYICMNAVSALTYAVYVGRMNLRLLVLMLFCYPVVLWISNRVVKKLTSLKKVHRQKSDRITEIAQDCMSGILVLRSFQAEDHFGQKLARAADDLVANEEKRTRTSNNAILIRRILGWMPNIICAVYAYVLTVQGAITLGGLLTFVLILGRFVDAFVGLPFDVVEAGEHWVCIRRVEEILRAKDEESGTETTDIPGADALAFEHVCFAYHEGTPVLRDLSFRIPQGSTVAFVGDSGGGKSTIFRLLCGFYGPDVGEYRLYGRSFAEWDLEAARSRIALVSQNVFLFPGSIRANVAYADRSADDEAVMAACRNAGIHDFIMRLPDRYDTEVGERGVLLSGGERQRISIARAFLKNAPILLMDEPTSAVDVETEGLIQQAMERLSQGRTCVIIAHRLSTVRHADTIMVLKDGAIAESGTHETLMDRDGIYRSMYGKEEA